MKRAFTLIELLVVIAIIAILAAILFPVFAQAKLAAKKTVDLSNLKQLATAGELWKADHDGYLIKSYANYESGGQATGLTYPQWNWDGAIQPYIKNKDIFKSPLDPGIRTFGQATGPTTNEEACDSWDPITIACTGYRVIGPLGAKHTVDDFGASYRLNASNQPNTDPRGHLRSALNESALESPSDALLIVPSGTGPDPAAEPYHEVSTAHRLAPGLVCIDNVVNVGFDRTNVQPKNPNRSQIEAGRANYGFADTHAANLAWRQTWKRLGPDVTDAGGNTVTPTRWRQNFSGTADLCRFREGDGR